MASEAQAYLCRYCGDLIPPERAAQAIRCGMEPSFCSPSHNSLQKQRKRRYIAAGMEGDELAQALAERVTIRKRPTQRRRQTPPTRRQPQRQQTPRQQPQREKPYGDILRDMQAASKRVQAAAPTEAPTETPSAFDSDAESAALDDLLAFLGTP